MLRSEKIFQKTNWIIFIILVLIGIVTAAITMIDLNSSAHAVGEAAQSRLQFRWGSLHLFLTIGILISLVFIIVGWKRLFPFNVPLTIIILGISYFLFFLTFTVGWVGIQGILGLMLALVVAMILIVSYSITRIIERRRMS